jgi:hypothetical protein
VILNSRRGPSEAGTRRKDFIAAPYPAGEMVMWLVDKRAGNVRNNDPALEAIAAE